MLPGRKITHEYIQESATTIVTIFTLILGVVQPATDEFKIIKAANSKISAQLALLLNKTGS